MNVKLELEVKAGSKLVGKTMAEAGFPRGCVVGAVAREDGETYVPKGDSEIMALDNVVVFVLRGVVDQVLGMFGVKKT